MSEARVYTDLVCYAIDPRDRRGAQGKGARTHGHFIGRVHGARMVFTGRILDDARDIRYHHGKVFYAARCPDPACEMISEFEIVPNEDGVAAMPGAAPAPRGASSISPHLATRPRRRLRTGAGP